MRARTLTLFLFAYTFELACLLIAVTLIAPPYLPGSLDGPSLRLVGALAGFACFIAALLLATDPGLHLRLDGQEWRGRLGAKLLGARHGLAWKIALAALAANAVLLELTTQDLRSAQWPSLAGLLGMGVLYWLGAVQILKTRGKRLVATEAATA